MVTSTGEAEGRVKGGRLTLVKTVACGVLVDVFRWRLLSLRCKLWLCQWEIELVWGAAVYVVVVVVVFSDLCVFV